MKQLPSFNILPDDRAIWNLTELVKFLIEHQGQHIELVLSNDGPPCKEIGLYNILDCFQYSSVNIITANQLEKHSKYNIIIIPSRFFKVNSIINSKYHTWNKQKIFGAFYGRPVWHRLGISSYLKTHYEDKSLVNMRADSNDHDARALFQMTELFSYAPESISDFANTYKKLPLLVESTSRYTYGKSDTTEYTDQLVEFYPDIFVDVVAETYTIGDIFFPTEKTFRPMLLKKPFISMAPANNLAYLRQLGFKTFYEFWDEDYDGYSSRDRYLKILKLIDSIGQKSKSDLEDMYQAMLPILDHNYNLLITQSYGTKITKI